MGVVHRDDLPHRRNVRELDVVEDAAAEERVRQLLLVVRGDEHDRPLLGDDLVARLGDGEAHLVELAEEVVRELEVGLVDLVDQQDEALGRRERPPERPELDVVADVGDVARAEAAVVQPLDRVVDVEPLDRLAGRLDVPLEHRHAEPFRDVAGEDGLARPGLALEEKGTPEGDRAVDGVDEGAGGDVAGGALEAVESAVRGHLSRRSGRRQVTQGFDDHRGGAAQATRRTGLRSTWGSRTRRWPTMSTTSRDCSSVM